MDRPDLRPFLRKPATGFIASPSDALTTTPPRHIMIPRDTICWYPTALTSISVAVIASGSWRLLSRSISQHKLNACQWQGTATIRTLGRPLWPWCWLLYPIRATIYTLNGNISLLDLVEPNETDRRKDGSHGKMRPSRKRRPRNIPFKFISSKLNFPVNSKARHSAQVSNDAYGHAAMVHSVSRLVDPYFPNMRMVIRLPAVYGSHV